MATDRQQIVSQGNLGTITPSTEGMTQIERVTMCASPLSTHPLPTAVPRSDYSTPLACSRVSPRWMNFHTGCPSAGANPTPMTT